LLRRRFAIFDGRLDPKGHLTTNRAIAGVGKTRSQFRRTDFRFTPQSRQPADNLACPKSADFVL
jgi:hypothetical protein